MQTRTLVEIVLLSGALAAQTACASAQAKSPDTPALDVPPPPPHVVEIAAEPLEPVGEIPSAPANAGPVGSRSGRTVPPKPQSGEAKPEAKPETRTDAPANPPAPAESPAPVAPPPPNPQLRTTQQSDTIAAANKIRATIDRANKTLGTVNYGPLSNERKKAYDDAKRFLQQAEDELKAGNLVFAQAVASKAETLASSIK